MLLSAIHHASSGLADVDVLVDVISTFASDMSPAQRRSSPYMPARILLVDGDEHQVVEDPAAGM